MAQRDTNPFPYSDTNKRYHTFDYFCRRRFGEKLLRIPLDGGFSCPNKDGTCGVGGCIFCADGSSGAASRGTLAEQYRAGVARLRGKWGERGTIPYLQANTGTYAAPEVLAEVYRECAALPGARALAIGTRADCLGEEVLAVLAEVRREIPLIVELGMQSSSEETVARIGRGYSHAVLCEGVAKLRALGEGVTVCLHILNGLPGEGEAEMLATAREAARLGADMVKIHTLCVLRGTPLAAAYQAGRYTPLSAEAARETVLRQLTLLPPETVIARLGADAAADALLAPAWVRDKKRFMNAVDRALHERGLWQGCGAEGTFVD